MKRHLFRYGPVVLFLILSLLYVYPVFQGLVLLPLDLLVSNYSPWHLASTILIKNSYMQDSIIQLYPWRHLTYESLRAGIIPFWNPYQFMGMPFMAGMKSMVWYPLNILFGLGEIPAWHALLVFQLFGSLIFMYLLLRDFGLRRASAIFGAVSFAFSSLMAGVLEFGSDGNVLVWLPCLLYLTKRFLDRENGIYLILLGVSTACTVFAGHLQYLAYEMITVGVFTAIYGMLIQSKIRMYIKVVLAVGLGIGISAVQLIPSLEMFRYSYRGIASSYEIFSSGLLKPFQLIRFLAPDFFGHPLTHDLQIGYIEHSGYFGIVPLCFALYAMIYERKNTVVKLFTLIFCSSVILSFDGVAQLIYRLRLPLITSGYGGRILFIALASGAILAGHGLSAYVAKGYENRKKNFIILFVGSVIFFLAGSFILTKITHSSVPAFGNIKFPIIILTLFSISTAVYFIARKYFQSVAVVLFIGLVIFVTYFDLFRLGYRFLTFSNSKFLYPDAAVTKFIKSRSANTMARVYGFAEPEIPTYLGVYSPETYNPLYPMRTAMLLQTMTDNSAQTLPVNKYTLSRGPRLKRLLDFLGVTFIVAPKDTYLSSFYFYTPEYHGELTKVSGDDYVDVYENLTAHPRFGLFYDVKQNMNDHDILQSLHDGSVDTRRSVLLETSIPSSVYPGTGSASLIDSSLNSQHYAIETNAPAVFYVSDTYYPGWKATIDNKEARIYRANYNFRAVLVPKGTSSVLFTYTPTWWRETVWTSVFSLIALCFLSFFQNRNKNKVGKKK